jgi:hypothetical protein
LRTCASKSLSLTEVVAIKISFVDRQCMPLFGPKQAGLTIDLLAPSRGGFVRL